jgi:formylmethanofuran dehydrogenase subunit A
MNAFDAYEIDTKKIYVFRAGSYGSEWRDEYSTEEKVVKVVNVVDVVEVDLVLVVVEKDVAVVPDQLMEKCVVMPNSTK